LSYCRDYGKKTVCRKFYFLRKEGRRRVSVKIRLQRLGRKKQPTYRIVVTESRNARSGKIIEAIGNYTPYKQDKPLVVDLDKIDFWRGKGAIPTDAVTKLIRRARNTSSTPAVTKTVKGKKPAAEAPVPEVKVETEAEAEKSPGEVSPSI
jgi:ribosomal protein S16